MKERESFTESAPGYTIVVNITDEDLNNIKRMTTIGTNGEDTYISILAELISSYGGTNRNRLPPPGINVLSVTTNMARRVRNFTSDTTNPELREFELDMDNGEIILTFDETVRASSLILTNIALQNERSFSLNSTTQFFLTLRNELGPATISSQNDGLQILITLGFEDMNDIKFYTDLAVSNETTFITFDNLTLLDMNNNYIIEISPLMARRTSNFTADMSSPVLVSFDLNLNGGFIVLNFSETVNSSSFHATGITLQSSLDGSGQIYTLSEDSYTISGNGYIITVSINDSDLNEIKRYTRLAQTTQDTYISIDSTTVSDMNDNPVQPIPRSSGEQVTTFIPDITPPMLQGFHLDMDSGVLQLSFDETVDVFSFIFSDVSFISRENLTYSMILGEQHTLRTDGVILTSYSTTPSFNISYSDVNAIKLISNLATELNNTFLLLDVGAINDTALVSNPLNPIFSPFQATNFTADTTAPMLQSFTANMDLGILSLVFDEPVNASSINFDTFILESNNSVNSLNYILTGGTTDSQNGRFIRINITDDDLNAIKVIEGLFDSPSTAYLRFEYNTIQDMAGNSIRTIALPMAVMSSSFMQDTTRPILQSFDIDLTEEVLTLHFDETVNFKSLNVSRITLQADFNISSPMAFYTLTGGAISAMDDTTIRINLITNDLNQLKTQKIAVNNMSAWLTVSDGLVLDQAGEMSHPLVNGISAIQVATYIPDIVRPALTNFTLDLDGSGTLWLTFTETVEAGSFDPTQITFQNSESRSPSSVTFYTLTNESFNFDFDIPIQRINLSATDLNEFKRLSLLATDVTNTYVAITNLTLTDVFGNRVEEISEDSGLQADQVIQDDTPPVLLGYELNLTSNVLLLSFSETMNSTSLNVSTIELLNTATRTPFTTSYHLSNSRVVSNDSTSIEVNLSTTDLNAIKLRADLAVSPTSTFIVIGSDGILDMNSNGLLEQTPLSPTSYFEDRVEPMLVDFNLDLNTGELLLVFDETVNGTSLNTTEIVLQNSATNATSSHRLTGPNFVTSNFTTTISITLVDSDLNEIKRIRNLGTNSLNTYISFSSGLILDMNFNEIVPISDMNAEPVFLYMDDDTQPALRSFELNLTSEVLLLSFSETVQADTVDLLQITIQNEFAGTAMEFVTLTGGTILSNDSTDIEIMLTSYDLNAIKERTEVATQLNNTFITASGMTVRDMNDNWNVPVQSMRQITSNPTVTCIPPEPISMTSVSRPYFSQRVGRGMRVWPARLL